MKIQCKACRNRQLNHMTAKARRDAGYPPTMVEIAAAVSEEFGVSLEQMRDQARTRRITRVRQLAMYLSRRLTKNPLEKIARAFGRSHHSTVIYDCRVVQKRLNNDPGYKLRVLEVLANLGYGDGDD